MDILQLLFSQITQKGKASKLILRKERGNQSPIDRFQFICASIKDISLNFLELQSLLTFD